MLEVGCVCSKLGWQPGYWGLLGCLVHGSSPEEETHVQMGTHGGSKGRG